MHKKIMAEATVDVTHRRSRAFHGIVNKSCIGEVLDFKKYFNIQDSI